MGNRSSERYATIDWPAPSNVVAYSTLRDSDLPDIPSDPKWLHQVHGANVVQADTVTRNTEADSSYTKKSEVVCVVRTADCLPILICDKQGTQVAAIHAGWRSMSKNIISETFKKMSIDPADTLVWLGPAIGPDKFEVDQDVLDDFTANGWDINFGFKSSDNKWLVDIYELAKISLKKLQVPVDNIYGGDFCTYSDPSRFYSYRRSKDVGRMQHLIWLK